jgi:transcriptional regulator with XRE-family HTH domain
MSEPATIGSLIQSVRKRRGLSQQELARMSGVSVSLIRQLEQEKREDTRLETLRKLAMALRVPTAYLSPRPAPDAAAVTEVEQWEPVRRAMFEPSAQPDEPASAEGVLAALASLRPAIAANRYAVARQELPAILRDCDALNGDGRKVRSRVLNLTAWLLVQTRQWKAADDAVTLAMDAADDRLDAAAAANTHCWSLLRQGRLADAREFASRWADDIEPRFSRATTAELALWGRLMLGVSNAAIRDARPGEAEDALRLASAAADRIGRETESDASTTRTFGPTTVAMIKCENFAVAGQPDKVLSFASTVPVTALHPSSASRCRHRLDVAYAYAQTRDYPAALGEMRQLAQAAPEWLVQQRYARDVMSYVISRRRTLTEEMRTMADFVDLPY